VNPGSRLAPFGIHHYHRQPGVLHVCMSDLSGWINEAGRVGFVLGMEFMQVLLTKAKNLL
jgi:hypothetical protein